MAHPIILVAGARPNFMKVGPIHSELVRRGLESMLVHTGQHYDHNMSQVFFDDLGISNPDFYMGVGSDSHSRQTAKIMVQFEELCMKHKPRLVVVVGDVNSTLACAITSAKLHIPVAHVEAGLRSNDMTMPEEVNRVLTDRVSDFLFTTSRGASENLVREGIDSGKIHFVGNVMIDSLTYAVNNMANSTIVSELSLGGIDYGIITLHRPSNVDDYETLSGMLDAIKQISLEKRLVFPAHPRTINSLNSFGFMETIDANDNISITQPLGYLDFVKLVSHSIFVMTDSGGLQEETTFLGVPCITLRENTERPITVTQGTNIIAGTSKQSILNSFSNLDFHSEWSKPELWDGRSASRIVKIIENIDY